MITMMPCLEIYSANYMQQEGELTAAANLEATPASDPDPVIIRDSGLHVLDG